MKHVSSHVHIVCYGLIKIMIISVVFSDLYGSGMVLAILVLGFGYI